MVKEYDKNVFINCPFDSDYWPLLKAMVFSLLYVDLIPRLALEDTDSSKVRLNKIFSIIEQCRYGIHDLSRITPTKTSEFFRLNMPFELGADFGCRRFNFSYSNKSFLVLAKEKYKYMQAISDLNGIDIKHHQNKAEVIVDRLREWIVETVKLKNVDGSLTIWRQYLLFQTKLFESRFEKYYTRFGENEAETMAKSDIFKITIPEYINEVKSFIQSNIN